MTRDKDGEFKPALRRNTKDAPAICQQTAGQGCSMLNLTWPAKNQIIITVPCRERHFALGSDHFQ